MSSVTPCTRTCARASGARCTSRWLQREGSNNRRATSISFASQAVTRAGWRPRSRGSYATTDPALQMRGRHHLRDVDRPVDSRRAHSGHARRTVRRCSRSSIAGIGMFALLAFQVARRTNELGVRMVLGATRGSMVGLVLKDVVWMLVPGIALGAGARAHGHRSRARNSLRAHADRSHGFRHCGGHPRSRGGRGRLVSRPARGTGRSSRGA